MNTRKNWEWAAVGMLTVSAAIGTLVAVADEVRVSLDQLPPAVRATMLAEAAGAELSEIEQETRDGQVYYEAEFRQAGEEIEIRVAADGALLGREVEKAKVQVNRPALQDLPEAARSAVLALAQGAPISKIETEREHDVTVYEAAWRVNGQTHEVTVTADGAVVETEKTVALGETPAAVQAAIAQHFGANARVAVERKTIVVYEAEGRVNGRAVELLIYPTGRVLEQAEDGDDGHDDDDGDDAEDHDDDDGEDDADD